MSRTEYVYSKLKEEIDSGFYRPSESLPEIELASKFDVSRNTVKKALLMLEKENYVVVEKNKGAKVRAYSLNEVLEYLEIRACLEGFILFKAIPHFTREKIDRLESILRSMKRSIDANELMEYSNLNQQFHECIYETCSNRTAVAMTKSLKMQMSKYNTKTILIPGRGKQSYSEHSAILDAIKNRDAELAESLVTLHVNNVRKTFSDHYELLF